MDAIMAMQMEVTNSRNSLNIEKKRFEEKQREFEEMKEKLLQSVDRFEESKVGPSSDSIAQMRQSLIGNTSLINSF